MTVYWPGNCAKHRAVNRILADAQDAASALVFDYGCGDGGDWPRVLRDYPRISLVGYEPDPISAERARERLEGSGAVITSGHAPPDEPLEAEAVVSFSVLEHVVDLPAYLETARRHLGAGGIFILNYDDGHFRNNLRLESPRSWEEPLRATVRHLVAPLRAAVGHTRSYVRRIPYQELDVLVEQAGFVVRDDRMENLADFKGMAKFVPEPDQSQFMALWCSVEDSLNRDLLALRDERGVPLLWQRMLSRTLVLQSADDA